MGMMKNYVLKVLEQCSEERFGQDAIEWAIVSGLLPLTYNLERDVRAAMSRYDEIIEAYRRSLAQAKEVLPQQHAPMQRAGARRSGKAKISASHGKAKHAA